MKQMSLYALLAVCSTAPLTADAAPSTETTCEDHTATRRPYFGDLHVHTSFSFDAYGLGNRQTDPAEAYRFARGLPIEIAPHINGTSTRGPVQLSRPLDFAAVTDHSEYLGETTACQNPSSRAYRTLYCRNIRRTNLLERMVEIDTTFLIAGLTLFTEAELLLCKLPLVDCDQALHQAWERTRAATDDANAAEPCQFSALHGYEYTGQVGQSMTHRNVIFGTGDVPLPVSSFEAPGWESLARQLETNCRAGRADCDFLAIPHNSNLSQGNLFSPTDDNGNPFTPETAALRQRNEVLAEIVQAKGESECLLGAGTPMGADEFCDFEKQGVTICAAGEIPCGLGQTPERNGCSTCSVLCQEGEVGGCTSELDYVRGALKKGLEERQRLGVNPFRLGVIGSTDTHNGTPGNTEENTYEGHHGMQDDEPQDTLVDDSPLTPATLFSPGGLAVVWAEQNTRRSIFAGLQRRETYATSGTRPEVRVFVGADLPADMCGRRDFAEIGYARGVPMGGIMTAAGTPKVAIRALRDPESAKLQRLHVVKLWVDEGGDAHEKVFDVTPGPRDYSASVDIDTCTPVGPGQSQMCTVWQDPEYNPAHGAAYYVRVLENPTCRWVQHWCQREQVDCATRGDDPDVAACCDDTPKTHQERAWTSPVFYEP